MTNGKDKWRVVSCPHCAESIQINWRLELEAGVLEEHYADQADRWKASLTEEQKTYLQRATDEGLLRAFTDVVKKVKTDHLPSNMEKFFLTFFQTSLQRAVPEFALKHFINEFPGGRITFIVGQGIVAVLDDGIIRAFIPQSLITGGKLRTLTGSVTARTPASAKELEIWTRTKFGYVQGGSLHAQELGRRSAGEFAKASGL